MNITHAVSRLWHRGTERRMSLENPLTNPRAYAALIEPSAAGVAVNERTLLGQSAVWCALTMIAGDFAKVPTFVYRRTANGKERDTRHPAYRVLRRRANDRMSAYTFRQLFVAHALLYNSAYAWIVRSASGAPLELIPLAPERVRFTIKAGRPGYEYTMHVGGQPKWFDDSDVLHLRGFTLDGVSGQTLMQVARQSLGRAIAADQYSARFFAQNATPSGLLHHPGKLDEEAKTRLRDNWHQAYGGMRNSFKVAVLEEAMTWTAIGVDAEKAQMLQTLEFSVREASRWFRIPASKLGDNSKSSYASLEQEQQSYYQQTLDPWFAAFREECYLKLLTEEEQADDSHTIEELQIAILRADASTRQAFYAAGINGGWLLRDEVRSYENLNDLPNGVGQVPLQPLNMVAATTDGPVPDPAQPARGQNPSIRAGMQRILDDVSQRICARLEQSAARGQATDPDAWSAKHRTVVAAMLDAPIRLARAHGWTAPDDLVDCILACWDGDPLPKFAPAQRAALLIAELIHDPSDTADTQPISPPQDP